MKDTQLKKDIMNIDFDMFKKVHYVVRSVT